MQFPHPHVSPVGVYQMPAAVVANPALRNLAQSLRVDREHDAREEYAGLAQGFADYFGATVEYYDPMRFDLEGLDPRLGHIEPEAPYVIHLARLGPSTNRATAHIALGSWLESQAIRILRGGPEPFGKSGMITIENTPTHRLSPASLGLKGRESGFDAANARFFQAIASLLLMEKDYMPVLCEMFLQAPHGRAIHLPELLARMSENPGITNRDGLMEYTSANLTLTKGAGHTRDNILISTALAGYLADLAINKSTSMLGLD